MISPTRFATYSGDVTHMALTGEVVGPTAFGEYLTAITAKYDAESNKTHVGFTFQKVEVAK